MKYPGQITDFFLYYSRYAKRGKILKICLKCIDWGIFALFLDLLNKSKDISSLAAPCSHIWGQTNNWAWAEPETLWRITVTQNGFLFISFSWTLVSPRGHLGLGVCCSPTPARMNLYSTKFLMSSLFAHEQKVLLLSTLLPWLLAKQVLV